jgi:molybdenum cofactor cytidylyltransferase
MGSNKLLLQINKKPVIEHILDRLVDIETIVVTGHRPEDIRKIVKLHRAKAVYNPDYKLGMTSSFQTGLRAIADKVDAVFMVLSDTFCFQKTLLDEMIQEMESTGALLVSPIFEGKRGHPVLIDRKLFPEFLDIREGENMRDIVLRHEDAHEYVAGDIWTRIDLNTPEDYAHVIKLWEKQVGS